MKLINIQIFRFSVNNPQDNFYLVNIYSISVLYKLSLYMYHHDDCFYTDFPWLTLSLRCCCKPSKASTFFLYKEFSFIALIHRYHPIHKGQINATSQGRYKAEMNRYPTLAKIIEVLLQQQSIN